MQGIHSFIHSFIHTFIILFIYSFILSFSDWIVGDDTLIKNMIDWLISKLVDLLIYWLIGPIDHLFNLLLLAKNTILHKK